MLCKIDEYIQPYGWVLEATRKLFLVIQQLSHPLYEAFDGENMKCHCSGFYIAQIAIGLGPDPIGIAHLYNRQPYVNPDHLHQDVSKAVENGWLTRVGDGAYCASAKAWERFKRICLEAARFYEGLRPLPLAKLQELDDLLGNLVDSIQRSGTLGYRPSFELDLQLGKGHGPVLQRICSKLSAILAYRDDAYLNAWITQEVNGFVWEAFTYVYKGKAKDAREIASYLMEVRHYDQRVYQQALDILMVKGWIGLCGASYEPTNVGINVVAQVARSLNQFFYTPWLDLEESHIIRLKKLLEDLVGSLKGEKPSYGSGYAHLNRTLGWGTVQWARDKA